MGYIFTGEFIQFRRFQTNGILAACILKGLENKHHVEIYGDPSEWPYNNFITGAKDKQGNFVQFAPKLKSQRGNFDPDEWAQLFADAGAKFAGPVAEHHDGFSMWASKVNPWNAKDMGPKLDLVGLLTDAIRKKNASNSFNASCI